MANSKAKSSRFSGLFSISDIATRIRTMITTAPRADLIAGLTLWGLIVPESIAYSTLAGAPPQAGVYAIMVMLPIYALFASSNFMVGTATSAVSATTAGFLALMASDAVPSLAAIVVAVGAVYIFFGVFRLGFVADFISEPVNRGFIFGLSFFVIISQLPKILGIKSVHGSAVERIIGIFQNIGGLQIATLILGIVLYAALLFLPRINRNMPAGLVVTVLAMVLSFAFGLEKNFDIEMVGALPQGLPKFVLPAISPSDLGVVILAAFGIAVLGMSESTAVSESVATQKDEKLNMNKQLFAFGVGNFVNGFFGGLASTGSMSSTSVNMSAGARTLMSTVYAAIAAGLTVVLFYGIFVYLPEAFLGVLIIHAVSENLRFRKIMDIRTYDKAEFWIAVIAALGVILFDVLPGLLLAMLLNILYFAYKATEVKIKRFGVIEGEKYALAPEGLDKVQPAPKNVLVLGVVYGSLYYADMRKAVEQLDDAIAAALEENPNIHTVVFNGDRLDSVHYTGIEMLRNFEKQIKKYGVKLYVTNLRQQSFADAFNNANFDKSAIEFSTSINISELSKENKGT